MSVTSVLQTVGQIAGIGGIALGVLLLLFREVIRKNIFPNLAQIQAYKLITLIIVLTFSIAALGIGAWVYVRVSGTQLVIDPEFPAANPETAIHPYLRLVDEGRYMDAYKILAHEATKRFHPEFMLETFNSQRSPRGNVLTRIPYGINTLKQLPDGTKGAFAIRTYVTDFEHGGKFLETVTTMGENGEWKVMFHQLAPCAPPYCIQ